MMELKIIKLFVIGILISNSAVAQRFKSTEGHISFFSDEILEDITAVNRKVQSVFDSETAQIVFSLPISGFEFEKSLMQEHFNEKYMESEKYPVSTFKGVITGYNPNNSNNTVTAEGDLEIHGVTRKIKVPGSLELRSNQVLVKAKFKVLLEDYGIEVPELMFQKIAEEIEITIELTYEKM